MGFQHGTRRSELVLFRERQGAQQVVGADCNVTLGEPLQKNLRPRGILIEECCRGGEQQDVAIAWVRAHGLFGLRQKPRLAIRIGKGGAKDLVPPTATSCCSAGLFRLITERQNRLRRGSTRHAKSCRPAFEQSRQIDNSVDRGYRGTIGNQARHGGAATRGCGEPAADFREALDLPASVTAGLAAVERRPNHLAISRHRKTRISGSTSKLRN